MDDSGALQRHCAAADATLMPSHRRSLVFLQKWQEYKRAERGGQPLPGPRPLKPIVVVHCTHGFNRTGAMLVHFAMRSSRWPDLLHFLQTFATCRPPGIYKQNYVERAPHTTRTCNGQFSHRNRAGSLRGRACLCRT